MQSRSALWKAIAATGAYRTETAAEIGGVSYASISAPKISRSLCNDALSVGNCVSATLSFSILTQNTIPKSAEILIKKRIGYEVSGISRTFPDESLFPSVSEYPTNSDFQYSEWLPGGTFFISRRKTDPVTGLRTLQCYDAMLKANAAYPIVDAADWPKTMIAVILEIASYIGVEVDSRTWEYIESGGEYVVPAPAGLTMQRVLGYIGAVHGGNWTITPDNRLRFVPLRSSADVDTADESDKLNVLGVLGRLTLGEQIVVTGVTISNSSETFTAGDSTGYMLTIPANPYVTQAIADTLFEKLGGLVYAPFTIEKGVYDPAAELGDYVTSKNDVSSAIYTETETYNLAFRGGLSAPVKAELEDEYPHIGTAAQLEGLEGQFRELVEVVADKASLSDLYAITAMIENLSVSDIKTGIIHSNDYEYGPLPLVYPQSALYPGVAQYPSNGEVVLRGFAIDFSTGTIHGAFYSEQINALQEEINALKTALVYPKSPQQSESNE